MLRDLAEKYVAAVRATMAAVEAEVAARRALAAAFRTEVQSGASAPAFVRVGDGLCVYFDYPDEITYGLEPKEIGGA